MLGASSDWRRVVDSAGGKDVQLQAVDGSYHLAANYGDDRAHIEVALAEVCAFYAKGSQKGSYPAIKILVFTMTQRRLPAWNPTLKNHLQFPTIADIIGASVIRSRRPTFLETVKPPTISTTPAINIDIEITAIDTTITSTDLDVSAIDTTAHPIDFDFSSNT
ncbi:uncharacterized protein AB675_3284 [Cyphellophora attinorum]|uniref:Uncharacterized protein n=1 Tax=Cyphellophora attinorum TaxID=1664694 RepID=A0A0N1H3T7_9EURO|nr:uncharacterized protein AB675_3284 [Phialophora attinorum]KPI39655.1 hypothetical protein AB675_3284 [Phialophora attinorum]